MGARGFGFKAVWGSRPVVQMFLALGLDLKVFWGVRVLGFGLRGYDFEFRVRGLPPSYVMKERLKV